MEGKDFGPQGSGYPSDPNTKAFLANCMQNVFGFPTFVRFSWSTIPKLIQAQNGAVVRWKEDLEDGGSSIRSICQQKKKKAKPATVLMKINHIQASDF